MHINIKTNVYRHSLANSVMALAVAGIFASQAARAAEKTDLIIEATAGKEFTISLDSNCSTGFEWKIAKPLDETLVKSIKSHYEKAPQSPDKEPVVGATGKEIWTFKALKSGKTTIKFKYVRPWEKDEVPAETKSVSVVLKAGE